VVRKVSWAKHRYFFNYCCFGYSLPWWGWEQWERLIDYMVLNGINAPLSVTGQEATWQAVCNRLELGDEANTQFPAGPPYLPFGWIGCLDGWGGPLPQSWIDSHEELDGLLGTREEFLLGKNLEDAKRWGTTPEERAILEYEEPEDPFQAVRGRRPLAMIVIRKPVVAGWS
jgi:hypothetical protein